MSASVGTVGAVRMAARIVATPAASTFGRQDTSRDGRGQRAARVVEPVGEVERQRRHDDQGKDQRVHGALGDHVAGRGQAVVGCCRRRRTVIPKD